MQYDFDRPEIEKLMGELLGDLVPDGQIGTNKVETLDKYSSVVGSEIEVSVEDADFILLSRRGGYLTDEFTDIIGLEVQVWALSRDRAVKLMDEITQRILSSEHQTVGGFLIDFVACLRGPEEDPPRLVTDKVVEQAFEFHIRVNWR